MDIIKLNNEDCRICSFCYVACENDAITLNNGTATINFKKCCLCEKCIKACRIKKMYYAVNSPYNKIPSDIAILPHNADRNLLNLEYKNIIDIELYEKVRLMELAFFVTKQLCNFFENGRNNTIFIYEKGISQHDLEVGLPLFFINVKPQNPFYIASFIQRLKHNDKDLTIDIYGLPFYSKLDKDADKMFDNVYDIPFKYVESFSILTLISLIRELNYFDKLEFLSDEEIMLSNIYYSIKILITDNIDLVKDLELNEYEIVFYTKEKYSEKLNTFSIKDEEINNLYKKDLKKPLKFASFLKLGE